MRGCGPCGRPALVRYLILAQLLAFALEPAVMWLHQRRGWRRGSATGLLLGGILVVFVLLGALLAPAPANGVNGAIKQVPTWIDKPNAFTQQHFNTTVVSASSSQGSSQAAGNATNYLRQHAGDVLGAEGSLLGRSSGCSRSGCSPSTSPPTAPRSARCRTAGLLTSC